jgi:membrane associated rhomboid family serine protease
MNPDRKRSILYFVLALLCAFAFFFGMFVGHVDHYLAIGGMILAAIGFFIVFIRAWARWEGAGRVAVDG